MLHFNQKISPFKRVLRSFVLFLGLLWCTNLAFAQSVSVNTCPTITKRSNGNGGASAAAGDFRPAFSQNNPVAANVVNTPYQKVPFAPTTKTGNITFQWLSPTAPVNLPVITRVWLTSTTNVTSLSAIKFGPPPPPTQSAPGKWISNYCFYNRNMPSFGKVTVEFSDPITGLALFTCTYDLAKNTPAAKPVINCIPTVVTNPVSVTTACGANVTSTFTASASGAATVTWQRSTDNGANWTNLTISGDYTTSLASQTATLNVANSLSHDGELYRVNFIGSGTCGSVQTTPAKLTSKPFPTATITSSSFVCGMGQVSVPVGLTGTGPWSLTYRKTTPGNPTGTLVTVTASTSPYYLKESNSEQTTYTLVSVTDQYCTTSSITSNNTFTQYVTPAITLSNTTPAVCFGTTSVNLPYSATTGSPNQYSITTGIRAMSGFDTAVNNGTLAASPISISVPPGTAAGTYDFNLTVTNSSSTCTSIIYPFTITINPPPVLSATASVGSICPGGLVNLTAAPQTFSTYSWKVKNTSTVIATTATVSNLTVSGTTTYEVTATDAIGCSAVAEVTVTALPLPSIIVTPSSANICSGGSVLLSATGAIAYTWSPSTGLSGTSGSSVIASPTQTTTYTVTGVSAGGCQATSTVTVTVGSANISVSGAGTICEGNLQPLTASGGNSYIWFPASSLYSDANGLTLIDPNLSYTTVYAKPSSTTTYQVRGGTSAGCFANSSATVTVTTSPINKATSTANQLTFCSKALRNNQPLELVVNTNSSSTFIFQNSSDGLNYSSLTTATISGVNATSTTTSTSAKISLNGITSSTPVEFSYFKILVTNGGCTFPYIIRLIDTSNPNSASALSVAIASASLCAGGTGTILSTGTLNLLNTANPFTVSWFSSTSNTFTSSTSLGSGSFINTTASQTENIITINPPASITPPSQTTYYQYALASSTNGCDRTSSPGFVTVNAAIASNTILPSTNCTGGTTAVTIDGNAITGAAYQWESSVGNPNNFATILGATSEDYIIPNNIVSTVTYFRRKATLSSCPENTSTSVAIYPPITANSISATSSVFCGSYSSVVLTGSAPSGADGNYSYAWESSPDGSNWTSLGITTQSYTTPASPISATTYYKRKVTSTGANCTTSEAIIVLTVNPGPTVSVSPTSASVCSGVLTTLTASGALNYNWSPSTGLNATTGPSVVATPSSTTTYTVTGTNSSNCSSTASVTITVTTSPVVPTLSKASETICSGTTVDLNSYLSPSVTAEWYRAPMVNASYIVSSPATVGTAGTYYVFAKSGTCYSSNYATFTLSITDVSKPTVASTTLSGCSNADLTVLEPLSRTGVIYEWHTVATNPIVSTKVSTPTSVGTGTYYLYAYSTTGTCYGPASDVVTVTVISTSTANVTPSTEIKCSPETIDLTALAQTPLAQSNWYTASTPTPSNLVPNPYAVATSGTYYLIPFNGTCQGTPDAVTVTINPSPVVTVSDPGLICQAASSVTLNATITNNVSSPTYQWQISTDGVSYTSLANGGVYSGATSAALGISNATGLGGNFYRCEVTAGSCPTISEPIVLAIEPIPTFTTQPADFAIGLGATATFTTVLTNDGTSTIQWQVSTNGGASFTDLTETSPYAGVSTTTLSVSNAVSSLDGYIFRLKATNSCGDYFSANAVLNILTNPSWEITKLVSASSFSAVGDKLNYTITLENTGDVNIGNISITDPDADAPGVARGTDLSGDNDASLEPGEKWSYTATHTITQADITAGKFTNTATASGTPAVGTLPNKSSSATSCAIPVISGTLNACVGGTTTLSASGIPAASGAWVSSNTAVASVNSSGVVTGVSQGTASITFTTLYGCTASATVTINPLPAAPTYTLTQPTCTTGTGTIAISGISGFQYSIDGSTYSTTTTYSNLAPGNYSVTAKNTNGCVSSEVIAVISSPPGSPVVPVFTASATTICSGSNATFTVSNANANQTYQWFRDGSEITGATAQTLQTNVGGSYTLKTTNASGCTAVSAATTLTVNPIPTATINQGSSFELNCTNGSSLSLSATVTPSGTATYAWYSVNTSVTPNTRTLVSTAATYAVTASGTYQVDVIVNNNGCIGSSNPVNISQAPTISSPTATEICEGGQFQLNSSTADKWLFSPDNTTYTEVSAASTTYNATVTGYYKVGNSCPVQLIVRPKSVVNISTSASQICAGASATISSTVTTANTPNATYQYQWLRDGVVIVNATSSTYSATLDGSYTLQVTNNFGCTSTSAGTTIDVVNNPVLVMNAPAAVCAPNTVDLTAAAVTAGSTSGTTITYWTDASGTQALSNPSQVSASGTYYLKLTNQNGCSSPVTPVTVTVNALPVFTAAASTTVCAPNTVNLTALVTSAQTLTYSFYSDAAGTALINNPTQISASGTYYAEGTNASGCSVLKAMAVIINPVPDISGTLTICEGATSQLTATGTPSAQTPWSSSNTSIATVSSTGLVTGLGAGTVTITYTNSAGCTDQVSISINAIPTITAASASVCQGSTLALTGNGTAASSNPWVSDNLIVATVSNTGVVTGQSAGTANITYTNISGCAVIYQVTVNALPSQPTVSITQPTCSVATGTILITSPSETGMTYSINNTTYGTSTTFTNLASGNYSVTAKSVAGCVSLVRTVTIDPALNAPSVPVITATGSTTVCSGENVTLNSSAAFGYQWFLNGVQIAGATSQSFTTNQAGTYTVEVRNSNGCKTLSTTPAVVVVNPIPEVLIEQTSTLGQTGQSCSDSAMSLEAKVVGNTNATNVVYEWYKNDVIIQGATSSVYSASSAGVYRVKVTLNSCSASSDVVTIAEPPSITNVNGSPNEICQGRSYTLTASNASLGQWQFRATSTGTWAQAGGNATGSTYNASVSGFYRVVVNGTASCETQVIVNPNPAVIITPASNLACAGTAVAISSNVTGSSATPFTYSWRLNSINLSNSNNSTFQAATSGTYSLRVTDAKGCSTISAGTAITINANPILVVNDPESVCQPSTIDLTSPDITTGSNLPAGTVLSYWTNSAATAALTDPTAVSVAVNALTTYYIKATTASGCSVISPVSVTINPRPSAAIATVTQPTCTVGTGTVTVTSPIIQGLSYSLDGINYSTSAVFSSVSTGNYQLYVKNASGCISVPTAVSINSQPAAPSRPVVTSAPGDTVCEGQSITLTSSSVSGNQWYKNGVLITGASQQTLVVTQSGSYTVKVTNASGCSSAESLARTLVFNDLPVVTIKQNSQLALSCDLPTALLESEVSPAGTYTYQWFRNGVPISGATSATYTASAEGNYKVSATTTSQCSSSSSELTVLPPASANATLAEVCNGQSITLTANAPAGYTSVTYQWQKKTGSGNYINETLPGAQSASYLVTSSSYSTTQTNLYRVQISGIQNGSAVSSATCPTELRVNAVPAVTVSATNNGALCSGNLGLLTATVTGSTSVLYQWKDGSGNPINGATANKLLVSTADTYSIGVTDGNGCSTSATQQVTVTASPDLSITPPAPTCAPASIDLTSSSITSGSILPSGTVLSYSATLNGLAIANPANVTTGGTYFIKATNGTCTDVSPVLVTIDPVPVLVITNPSPVCATGQVNLTAGSVTTGSTLPFGTQLTYWQNSTATIALSDPGALTVSGTYYIKAQALSGCSDIKPVTVVVSNSNSANIVINNPAAVCAPGSVDLTAAAITAGSALTNPSFSYWTDANASNALINPSAVKVSGTYYIDILSGNCSEVRPVVVTIKSAPAKPTITLSEASICTGNSTTVTAIPQTGSASDYTYAWTVPNGVSAPGDVQSFSTSVIGNYSVAITNKSTNCTSPSPNATAEVKAAPVPVISGTLNACIGGTTQLSGSGTPAASNAWSSSNTAIATVSVLGEVTGVSAGTATITYTNSSGCTATAVVTINGFPTISGTLTSCLGSNSQLIGSGTPSAVSPWVSSNTAVATITSLGVVSALSAGTSTITYTNNSGCKVTAVVTVNSLPSVTGTLSVCIGGTTQLAGSGTTSSWISGSPNIATISNSGLVTGLSAGTATIIYTNSAGCSATATVSINGAPTITGVSAACVGQTATLTGSGLPASINAWSSSNSAVVSISAAGVITGVSTGTATVTYLNSNGCSSSTTITVSGLPAITGTTALCVGQTSSLTGSGTAAASNTWVSSNTNVATVSTSGVVTAIGAGTALVTYTNSGGCSAAVVITVSAIPTITGTLNACVGGTTQLTGSGFVSAWTSSNTSVATVNSTGVVTGVAVGTATITYITTGGCQTTATVNILALPTLSGTLSACVGGTTQLTGSGSVLGWSSDNTAIAVVSNSGLVTGISAGTANITYTSSTGCSKTATVTINSSPSISGTLSACAGGTTQLVGTGTAASWSSSNTNVATVSNTGLVTGVASGTATITYINSTGCQATATLVVNALPSISGTLSACIGGTTQLSGTGTSAGWSSSNTSVATVSSTGLVTGVTAGTTTITYTNNIGCQVSATVTIAAPPIITGTLTACAGSSTQLTGSGVPFAWTSSNSNVATVDNTGKVTGISAGTAVITYLETGGCSATATVTINALPAITGTNTICTGLTTTLAGSGTPDSSTPWTSLNPSIATVSSSGVVTGVTTGTAVITYTNSSGCQLSINVVVNPTPTISGNGAVCAGETLTLTGTGTAATQNPWVSSNLNVATVSNTGVVTAIGEGTVTITYKNSSGCSVTKSVTVNPLPQAPRSISGPVVIEKNSTNTYQVADVPGATTYQWTLPSGWTGTSTTSSISVTSNSTGGTIRVKAVTAAGCIGPEATLAVQIRNLVIVANNDNFSSNPVYGKSGGSIGSIYDNDTFDGQPIKGGILSKIVPSIVDNDGIGGLIIDATGNLIIPPDTRPGVYEITYKICEAEKPTNCSQAVITIEVLDNKINVPEGISPQGDGKNDKWVIKGLEDYPDHKLTVYNRWGNIVYKAAPYKNDWDGRSQNALTVNGDDRLPAGTYYWVIELGDGSRLAGYLYIAY